MEWRRERQAVGTYSQAAEVERGEGTMGGIARDAGACSMVAPGSVRRAPLLTPLVVALLVGLVSCAGGCKTRELEPEETFERGPLPYHVGIYLDLESFQFPANRKNLRDILFG